jgi:hypothetical protein
MNNTPKSQPDIIPAGFLYTVKY